MERDLEKYLKDILNECLDEVALRVQEELKRVILEYVYNPMTPTTYERTWQFYDSFVVELSQKLTKRIYHDPSLLKYNKDKYQHGGDSGSRTNIMAEILNDFSLNGRESDFGGALNVAQEIHSKGYWDAFLEILDNQFDKWCQEEIEKLPYGIKKVG